MSLWWWWWWWWWWLAKCRRRELFQQTNPPDSSSFSDSAFPSPTNRTIYVVFPQLLIKHILEKTLVSTQFDKYKTQTQRRCITCLGVPKISPCSGPQLPAINGWKSCDLSLRCWGVHRFLGSFCLRFLGGPKIFSAPRPKMVFVKIRMLAYEQWTRAPGGCLGDL